MKKVLVLSSSLRKGSNSETLAQEFAKGAAEAGNKVEFESLRGKKIGFCMGCLACQKKGKCVIKDDAPAITKKMESADVIVFATPIYYYEMSGQLKTMLDRANSLYASDYKFREIYLLTSAADTDAKAMNIAKRGHWRVDRLFRRREAQGLPLCHGSRKRRRCPEEFRAPEKSVRHGKESLTTRR